MISLQPATPCIITPLPEFIFFAVLRQQQHLSSILTTFSVFLECFHYSPLIPYVRQPHPFRPFFLPCLISPRGAGNFSTLTPPPAILVCMPRLSPNKHNFLAFVSSRDPKRFFHFLEITPLSRPPPHHKPQPSTSPGRCFPPPFPVYVSGTIPGQLALKTSISMWSLFSDAPKITAVHFLPLLFLALPKFRAHPAFLSPRTTFTSLFNPSEQNVNHLFSP